DKIKNIPDRELVIISTGSQGEPMSALTRMAGDEFSHVRIGSNDTVIISASPIPGNERSIYQVINNLYRKGAEVVYDSIENIHVSGHACQEELKILHSIIKPKFFIPVHGEYRHLKKHVDLAKNLGMKDHQVMICELGDAVAVGKKSMRRLDRINAGSRFVDGLNIDDSTSPNVRDRIHLAEEGFIVVLTTIYNENGEILSGPDIIARGIVLTDEQTEEMKELVLKALSGFDLKSIGDLREVKKKIRSSVRNYIMKKTKGNPMVLPLINEL
ncbi:MAG: ribonuclease J, partial [Clostridia bacterium]|nr:ribonuclease J [Clostridia bacterium]